MFKALLVKFIMTLIISVIAFSFFDLNPAAWVIFVAVAVTLVNYLVGDSYALPIFGNMISSIVNGGLSIAVAYFTGLTTTAFNPTLGPLMFFGAFIAAGEVFFHAYLLRTRTVSPEHESDE